MGTSRGVALPAVTPHSSLNAAPPLLATPALTPPGGELLAPKGGGGPPVGGGVPERQAWVPLDQSVPPRRNFWSREGPLAPMGPPSLVGGPGAKVGCLLTPSTPCPPLRHPLTSPSRLHLWEGLGCRPIPARPGEEGCPRAGGFQPTGCQACSMSTRVGGPTGGVRPSRGSFTHKCRLKGGGRWSWPSQPPGPPLLPRSQHVALLHAEAAPAAAGLGGLRGHGGEEGVGGQREQGVV